MKIQPDQANEKRVSKSIIKSMNETNEVSSANSYHITLTIRLDKKNGNS